VQNSRWRSLRWIHRLYRKHTIRRFIGFISLGAALSVLAFQLLLLAAKVLKLQHSGVNILFSIICAVLLCFIVQYLRGWSSEGFRIRTFFKNLENENSAIANRASLLVYTETQPEEIERLGYSKELIDQDDKWLDQYISSSVKHSASAIPMASLIVLCLILLPSIALWRINPEFVNNELSTISDELWVSNSPQLATSISTVNHVSAARGAAVALRADWINPDVSLDATIHFRTRNTWNKQSVHLEGDQLVFRIPSVNRAMDYYFSAGNILSNKGSLTPIDPPAIASGEITITPPLYTGLKVETIDRLRPASFPEGSKLVITAEATTKLASATVFYNDKPYKTIFEENTIFSSLIIDNSGDLYFLLEDEHGLKNKSPKYRMTAIADATPTLDISSPKAVSTMPSNFQLTVKLQAHDDYILQLLHKHIKINGEKTDNNSYLVWENKAKKTDAGIVYEVTSDLFVTYDWSLLDYKLFPGDEISFSLEVWDNDAIHGPKAARSQTFTVKYPTLVDLLSQLDQKEEAQITDLSDLVEEQTKITEEARKTLEKIAEKMEQRDMESGDKDQSTWMEEKELESIKDKQQKLIDKASKIEKELEEYREQAEKALEEQPEDQQGFSPETLEKIEKIQQLMKQLMDEDSQNLMKKIDQTVEQLSQQITDEQLQELNFSFEDFEQQLERTLSTLEDAFETRKLEGLQQMSQELAQRQEKLESETEQLAKDMEQLEQDKQSANGKDMSAKEQALESQKKLLEQRQNQIEEDVKSLLNAMKEREKALEESHPEIAQKMDSMQQEMQEQGLQSELSKASQKMQSNQMKQAQQHQKKAKKQLQSLAQQFEEEMFNMGGMNMEADTQALSRLIYQGLFLSEQMEFLTESTLGRSEALGALRCAQVFNRELARINFSWQEIAKTNPFLNREADVSLQHSAERLNHAIDAGQGEKWIGLHETRSSMNALNQGIYQMMQDMQSMQQQMDQTQSQGLQQQMQQMISQQQSLQQMLKQMQQMGEKGQQMMEQLQEMAKEQARIRKEIEKMMQRHRHAKQLKNQLDGIYQEMKEVEKLLKEGVNNEQVEEKQKKIMTRMLEAGTMQEEDDYGEEREEEVAETGFDAESPELTEPISLPDKIDRYIERPPIESIPFPYREALKKYYIRLSDKLIP
jgi:hypothetical protein